LVKVAEYASLANAQAESNSTQTVEYEYDAFNQLIGRKLDADGNPATTGDIHQTKYVFDNGQVVLQFEKTGAGDLDESHLSNRYFWGPAIDMLLADEQITWTDTNSDGADDSSTDNETLWALTDHLGSVRDLVDDSGTVQNHKSYDSYGNVTAETNATVDTVFAFTGKLFDDSTELQNNLNRWYDAEVGRWVSEDPIGFEGGDSNLSRYAFNEVTIRTDPTGEIAPVIIVGIVIVGGVVGAPVVNAPGPNDPTYSADDFGMAASIFCGVLFAQAYFPEYLYHYTTAEGYAGIISSGTILPGGGIIGRGVYASSFLSPTLARLMGARGVECVIRIPAGSVPRIPSIVPGAWKIPIPVPIR